MPLLPGTGNLWKQMRAQDSAGPAPAAYHDGHAGTSTRRSLVRRTRCPQTYKYAYNGHLPIGPSCCVADVTANGATIYSQHAERPYATRHRASRRCLGCSPVNQVRVSYYEGSSVVRLGPVRRRTPESAAVMSQLAGAPVRLQFMRWDEHGYDNYGPAMMFDIQARRRCERQHADRLATYVTELRVRRTTTTTPAPALTGRRARCSVRRCRQTRRISGSQYNAREHEGDQQVVPLSERLLQDLVPEGPRGAADLLRLRAGDRRARLRGEHGPACVPPAEHRRNDDHQRRSGWRC